MMQFPRSKLHFSLKVVEMCRRIFFVGVIPLLAGKASERAAIGVLFAVFSVAIYSELKPFESQTTNVLALLAQCK